MTTERMTDQGHQSRAAADPSHQPGHGYGHGLGQPGSGADTPAQANRRRLIWTLALATTYMVAEVVGGLLSNSLALLADAGHMLSDAASMGLALFALWIGQRPASTAFSYGYRRAEVLAALVNAVALLVVAGGICLEAYQRFRAPPLVNARLMLCVAVGGLLVNLAMLRVLSGGRHDSLNVEGAWLHVLSDLLGSVGAVASGILIWRLGWHWVDPVASVLIALIVISSGLSLLRRTATVLMEGTPAHIDADAVQHCMQQLPGVCSVHHLHVWTITGGLEALSAHVVIVRGCDHDLLLERIRAALRQRFRIGHVTIQFEHQHCGDEH
jgi:cobalt-zinc-cadmium efflux system protein